MADLQATEPTLWYVMSTLHRRELKVQDDLRHHGFECYIPMSYEVRQRYGRKQRVLMPAVRNLIFARGTVSTLKEYMANTPETVYFRTQPDCGNRHPVVVGDREMENFIRLTQHVEQQLTYFAPGEIKLQVGDKIKIHGGIFDGVEGVLVRLPGKRSKSVVVSLPSVMDVAVSLQPEVIELIDQSKAKKHGAIPVEDDTKQLFQLAYRRLFASPDPQKSEHEYNLLMHNLRHIYERLSPIKGYVAQREGELALTLYLASVATGEDTMHATERMETAMEQLKASSLLKLRMQMYYAIYRPDAPLLQRVKQEIRSWSRLHPSIQQKKLLDEIRLIPAMNP